MRRSRKVKILATLGPASSGQGDDQEPVRGRRRRLPHQHEPHRPRRGCARWSAIIREVEADCGRPIGILADLQGPKLRIGTFAERAIDARARRRLHPRFRSRAPATPTRVELPHPEIFAALEPGHRLLLDDGKVRLRVTECSTDARGHHRRGRHPALRPQGRQRSRFDHRLRRADRQGPLRPRGRAQRRRRLDRALLRPAARRIWPRSRRSPAAAPACWPRSRSRRRSSGSPRSSSLPTR